MITSEPSTTDDPGVVKLHWDPHQERRGLGSLVKSVNHIALIVADVGRSLIFYTDVLGLQQIQRPDFDRHGGWLTCGNVEIHLIKGVPLVHSGENLIVSHIAIDVDDPMEAFRRLKQMGIPFEVNVSVPKGKGKAESEGGDSSNTLGQAFLRDPDGYYIEICNCNVLTDFALAGIRDHGEEDPEASDQLRRMSLAYVEGVVAPVIYPGMRTIAVLGVLAAQAKRRVKEYKRTKLVDIEPLPLDQQPDEADPTILANFIKRRQVYGDICQSFDDEELPQVLREAGNNAPTAILLMQRRIFQGHKRLFFPPAYYVESSKGSVIKHWAGNDFSFKPESFEAPIRRSTKGIIMTAGLRLHDEKNPSASMMRGTELSMLQEE